MKQDQESIDAGPAGTQGAPLPGLLDSWIANLAVLLVAAIVYIPAIFGSPVWDDKDLLTGQGIGGGDSLLHCFTRPFLTVYFRPLVSATFYIDRHLFPHRGDLPPATVYFHLTNVLIHVVTTALVMGLVSCALRGAVSGGRISLRRAALCAGLLFAVQPVQVAAIAFVGGRTDAIAALFAAAFAWAIVASARATGRRRTGFCLLGALLYCLALLAKEQCVTLLPLAPLAYICFKPEAQPERGRDGRAALFALLPFGAVTLAFLIIWKIVVTAAWRGVIVPGSPAGALPAGAHAVQIGDTLLYYASVLIAPTPAGVSVHTLDMFRPFGALAAALGFAVALAAALGFALTLAAALGFAPGAGARLAGGAGPIRGRSAAWFLGLIALPLLPVANISTLSSFLVAPYRAAVSGVGAVVLLVMALEGLSARRRPAPGRGALRWLPAAAPIIAVCWWMPLTIWSASRWKSETRIAATVVQYDPESLAAREGYCEALWGEQRTPEAAAVAEEALVKLFGADAWQDPAAVAAFLRAHPDFETRTLEFEGQQLPPRMLLATLYADLGGICLERKERERAYLDYRIALSLYPSLAEARMGMGECAGLQGDFKGAERWLRWALAADRKEARAWFYLGTVLAMQDRWADALPDYAEAVRLQPAAGRNWVRLARAYVKIGRRADAIRTLRAALERCQDPAEAVGMLSALESPEPPAPNPPAPNPPAPFPTGERGVAVGHELPARAVGGH